MNDASIERILRGQNRWWRSSVWEVDDQDLRGAAEARFKYEPQPLSDVNPPGLYILWGPRRVGKSVELKRLILELIGRGVAPRSIFYCSCEGFSSQDFRRLFSVGRRIAIGTTPPYFWLLDEITSVIGGWAEVVKHLRDQTSLHEDCVVLTGSSARELRSATKALADRRGDEVTSDRLLLPMSFTSFAAVIGMIEDVPVIPGLRPRDVMSGRARTAIQELSYHQEALGNAWESYLTHGGFPRAVDSVLKTGDVSEGFAQGMWQIIKGDAIRDNAQINDLQLISFLHRLSQNLASPINASAIGKEIGLGSHHRVLERIEDLCQAFLAWRCCQAQGELPNPAAQWKLYFVDPLLAQLAARLDERYPLPDRSVIAEQQLGLLLLRAVEREVPGSFISSGQVMFERSSSRTEIDFVGPRLGVSFESKYVDTVWRRAARTMELRHGGGVLVTRSRLDLNGPVWVVPAGVLGWLLDH